MKYLRLVKRTISTETRWSVQLVLEGLPHEKSKNSISDDACGLDIGLSTIAVVREGEALLAQFCDAVVQPWKEIRREQRATVSEPSGDEPR